MIITNHAKKRFKERYGIKDIRHMVNFAKDVMSKGKEPDKEWNGVDMAREGFDYYIYKQLDRNVFIFQQKADLCLITIYKI